MRLSTSKPSELPILLRQDTPLCLDLPTISHMRIQHGLEDLLNPNDLAKNRLVTLRNSLAQVPIDGENRQHPAWKIFKYVRNKEFKLGPVGNEEETGVFMLV